MPAMDGPVMLSSDTCLALNRLNRQRGRGGRHQDGQTPVPRRSPTAEQRARMVYSGGMRGVVGLHRRRVQATLICGPPGRRRWPGADTSRHPSRSRMHMEEEGGLRIT